MIINLQFNIMISKILGKDKINLIYWEADNFGDILNKDLIEELTGKKTVHKEGGPFLKNFVRLVLSAIIKANPKLISKVVFPWQTTYVWVGSILCWADKHSKIWGAGFMNNYEKFSGGEVYAVRGPLTNNKLKELGGRGTDVYGDPALLLPLWIPEKKHKRYKLGIIPHWKETEFFKERFGSKYNIIDLRTRDVKSVMNQILDCEYILSSSLHGLIVPHAYNRPALWIKHGYIDTDGFKFEDYFASVGIPNYSGFENFESILESEEKWMELFEKNKDIAVPHVSIMELQKKLLSVAPFPLKEKYKIFQ